MRHCACVFERIRAAIQFSWLVSSYECKSVLPLHRATLRVLPSIAPGNLTPLEDLRMGGDAMRLAARLFLYV